MSSVNAQIDGEVLGDEYPGPAPGQSPLEVILALDISGSMGFGGKMGALLNAILMLIPALRDAAARFEVQMLISVLTFGDEAKWHGKPGIPVEDFEWKEDLKATGRSTVMGKVFRKMAKRLTVESIGCSAKPPVIILITDGHGNDDVDGGMRVLLDSPWGGQSVRMAVCIGADCDRARLEKFVGESGTIIDIKHPAELAQKLILNSIAAINQSVHGAKGKPAADVPDEPVSDDNDQHLFPA